MPLFTSAFRALASARGVAPIPVFDAAWPSPFGALRYSDRPRGFTDGSAAAPLILEVPSVSFDAGTKPGNLAFSEASVVMADKDRRITRILEGGVDPRGTLCSIRYALDGLAEADWHTVASGIFDREEYQDAGRSIQLYIRPNDTPFQGSIPKAQILKPECPLALAASFGVYIPLLYGQHDSTALTGKGMVPAINYCYDASQGWHYVLCLGRASSVDAVYKNGTLQVLTTDYTISYRIIGGKLFTSIDFVAAPGDTAVITADAVGYETVGDGSGDPILNPVDQLVHALTNFGFNDYRLGVWFDPSTVPLELGSLAIASSYASRSKFEGGIRLGGTTQAQKILDVVTGWLNSELPFRVYSTSSGKMGMRPLDHVFGGYTSPGPAIITSQEALFARGQVAEIGTSFKPSRDTSLIVRRVDLSYLYGAQDQKFWQALAIQDVSQTEEVGESYDLSWSAPRIV